MNIMWLVTHTLNKFFYFARRV